MRTSSSIEPRLPQKGDVVEFAFLWSHERDRGSTEASKARRCVVVAVLENGHVMVSPITSRDPGDDAKVKLAAGAVGLTKPSWIAVQEINVTDWPGHDARHAFDPKGAWWRHGALSAGKWQELADTQLAAIRAGRAQITPR